jgi:hypothetical protein
MGVTEITQSLLVLVTTLLRLKVGGKQLFLQVSVLHSQLLDGEVLGLGRGKNGSPVQQGTPGDVVRVQKVRTPFERCRRQGMRADDKVPLVLEEHKNETEVVQLAEIVIPDVRVCPALQSMLKKLNLQENEFESSIVVQKSVLDVRRQHVAALLLGRRLPVCDAVHLVDCDYFQAAR